MVGLRDVPHPNTQRGHAWSPQGLQHGPKQPDAATCLCLPPRPAGSRKKMAEGPHPAQRPRSPVSTGPGSCGTRASGPKGRRWRHRVGGGASAIRGRERRPRDPAAPPRPASPVGLSEPGGRIGGTRPSRARADWPGCCGLPMALRLLGEPRPPREGLGSQPPAFWGAPRGRRCASWRPCLPGSPSPLGANGVSFLHDCV